MENAPQRLPHGVRSRSHSVPRGFVIYALAKHHHGYKLHEKQRELNTQFALKNLSKVVSLTGDGHLEELPQLAILHSLGFEILIIF